MSNIKQATYIISDLHIAGRDRFDAFAGIDTTKSKEKQEEKRQEEEAHLIAFLNHIAGSAESVELIFNGDTFDFIQTLPGLRLAPLAWSVAATTGSNEPGDVRLSLP